jgi:hypothetical protein
MWEYLWPDMAYNLVKGLVAGGASLALQALAPSAFRGWKRLRARRHARKAAREQQIAARECDERKPWRWPRLRR